MSPARRAEVVELLRCAAVVAIGRGSGDLAIYRARLAVGFEPRVELVAFQAEDAAFPGLSGAPGRHLRLVETALLLEEGWTP